MLGCEWYGGDPEGATMETCWCGYTLGRDTSSPLRMLRHSATSGSDIHVDVDRSSWSGEKTDACCTAGVGVGVGVACCTLCCKADSLY